MATLKEFTFVGVSKDKGKFKVRYANNKNRIRTLEKNGHTDVFFIALEQPEGKEDCIDKLLDADMPCTDSREAVLSEARELGFEV
jgi:hypothetical protein